MSRRTSAWIAEQTRRFDVAAVNTSSRYALIALQGPLARQVMQRLSNVDLAGIKYYWFAHGEIAGVRGTLSRTGYTGEDGFEVFVPPHQAVTVWDAILEAGRDEEIVPAGLGARDTLRLEAAMRLYGNDIDDTTTVLDADLEWIIGWNKGDFLGRQALADQKARGVVSRIVGFEMKDRAIARHGYPVVVGGAAVGRVTSGTQTPFLKKAIGMAYVPVAHSAPGTEFDVDVRAGWPARRSSRCRSTNDREGDMYPADCKYTKDHEWIKVTGETARWGSPTTRRSSWATSCTSTCLRSAARSRSARASGPWSRSRPCRSSTARCRVW